MSELPPALRRLLVLAAVGLVVWVRTLPLALAGAEERAAYLYRGPDGRERPYLGDFDSYVWLRHARNYLREGTTCDAVVGGECRDTYANAPVGARMRYARSLHIVAIVAVHRAVTAFDPHHPLPASAFLVPVIAGALAVLPAFGIGRRLAGDLGGLGAAVAVALSPFFLERSIGSDNDVWNVLLPLCAVWGAVRALGAAGPGARIGFAALAGAFAALHAATWRGWVFTYGVLLGGLAAAALVRAARGLVRGPARGERPAPTSEAAAPRRVPVGGAGTASGALASGAPRAAARHAFAASIGRPLAVLAVFYVAAGIGVGLAASDEPYFSIPLRLLAEVAPGSPAPAPVPGAIAWPDTFATVAELRRTGRSALAASVGGPLVLFAGWLGLLVVCLPRRGWRWWHLTVLIGGNYLYRRLVIGPELGRPALLGVLALPVAAALCLRVAADADPEPGEEPAADAGLIVAVWLLAALFLAYGGARYLLLVAAPLGIAFGVALGRLHAWLDRSLARLGARAARPARAVLPVALALTLAVPAARGREVAAGYLPRIDNAWWGALEHLRDETPPDAIVVAWWDYGHWIKYVAERRVTSDGGSLATHVPHWVGRALLAPSERESLGLLRMLACGSDATPEPEGRLGAYGKLTARGLGGAAAHALIVDLAGRDRAGADALLAARGLDEAARDDVLASTHCAPPPSYLVLSTEQVAEPLWWHLGRWDPARADGGGRAFAHEVLLTREWIPCPPAGAPGRRACALAGVPQADGSRLAGFAYDAEAPGAGRLLLRWPSGAAGEGAPGLVLLATPEGLEEIRPPAPTHPKVAVLLDPASGRALLGLPEAMRSTFTGLVFLDGRYARRLRKIDERGGHGRHRLVTWEVRW